jgi:Na+-translocating ferredoxin:NAD+ oxidoreductase RNF subunit RnfB
MELEQALVQASEEVGLQDYYRDMVRPLLRMPRSQWPSCCGAGCEPCAQTLVAVAERVNDLLGA